MDIAKVLIADQVDDKCMEILEKNGIEVDRKYKLPKEELIKIINNYDGLIVRSDTKVTADVLNNSHRLKVIGRAGVGVDNVDVPTATTRKIIVINTPGGNAISACELTCALLTNLARNVVPAAIALKDGRWERKLFAGHELYGKTLAIIGLGRIGREVAIRMQAWGMNTIGYDPLVSSANAAEFGVKFLELNDIWPIADYITVHTPLIPATKNLINADTLAKCKRGVRLVNVARGGIINESDLLTALESGQCGGAGMDVYVTEPPTNITSRQLIGHQNVIATPHLGASTSEAQIRVAAEIAEQFVDLKCLKKLDDFLTIPGVVNRNLKL